MISERVILSYKRYRGFIVRPATVCGFPEE